MTQMIRTAWKLRGALSAAWILSCAFVWALRRAWLSTIGLGAGFEHLPPLERFNIYSDLEAMTRVLQGVIFFLLVSLHSLRNVFRHFDSGDC